MKISELMRPDGRVFLKSEFGQIGDEWPCVSFSRPSVGVMLRNEFKPGRDVLIYVGTQNPELTEDPEHRARLISAVVIDPRQVLETRKIVAPQYRIEGGAKWPSAVAVLKAALIDGPPYPSAYDFVPETYSAFGSVENRGKVLEATASERDLLMELSCTEVELHLSPDVQAYVGLKATFAETSKSIQSEAIRMADRIYGRVQTSGEERTIIAPFRSASNYPDLCKILIRKWQLEQGGVCALCGGSLVAETLNKMMQPSPDRIDNSKGVYDESNLQITHLACNLARNKYDLNDFEEWLLMLRCATAAPSDFLMGPSSKGQDIHPPID